MEKNVCEEVRQRWILAATTANSSAHWSVSGLYRYLVSFACSRIRRHWKNVHSSCGSNSPNLYTPDSTRARMRSQWASFNCLFTRLNLCCPLLKIICLFQPVLPPTENKLLDSTSAALYWKWTAWFNLCCPLLKINCLIQPVLPSTENKLLTPCW